MVPAMIRMRRTFGLTIPVGVRSSLPVSVGGTLTLVAFSSPTSISTLIESSLRVRLFHLPHRACIVRARLVEAVQSDNLVVVGACQGVLRLNDLNVVGYPGVEPVARLHHFFLGELDAKISDLHFIARRCQVQQGCLYVQRDLVAE